MPDALCGGLEAELERLRSEEERAGGYEVLLHAPAPRAHGLGGVVVELYFPICRGKFRRELYRAKHLVLRWCEVYWSARRRGRVFETDERESESVRRSWADLEEAFAGDSGVNLNLDFDDATHLQVSVVSTQTDMIKQLKRKTYRSAHLS